MRLDVYLAAHGFSSRTRAARAVREGRVLLNGKPGRVSDEVRESDAVEILEGGDTEFVSEGGKKLRSFFRSFPEEDVGGLVCADLGASTGGFCDVLLRAGAKRVYAVDVGEGQLDGRIAEDPRVVVMDRTNARYLDASSFPERVECVTGDVSFISLSLLFPAIAGILPEGGKAYLLAKPQFECGGKGLDRHGIVKDPAVRAKVIAKLCEEAELSGLSVFAGAEAPRKERKNREYVLGFVRGGSGAISAVERTAFAEQCVSGGTAGIRKEKTRSGAEREERGENP